MAGSAYFFQSGKLNLYQTLLVKNDQGKSGLPLGRADLYAKREPAKNEVSTRNRDEWSP
jgi:hypothetical protein